MDSPGRTAGFMALASSLTLRTERPWRRATIEIEIVGDNFGTSAAGEFHELLVDARLRGDILFDDADFEGGHFLEALENFKAAAATLALERIGRIGDQLKFVEDETGNAERAIEEMGFADVGDAAVNEDAGVEKFEGRQITRCWNRD